MKKIYLLALLCCFSWAAFSQTTTTLWSSGSAGSYTTANCTSTGVRTDGNIIATGTAPAKRGYAVFDLSTIPVGSTINGVTTGYYVSGYTGTTVTSTTYGYAGDLSLVTTPATLYTDMVAGSSLSTVAYLTGTGNHTVVSTPAAIAFIQANIGNKVSICWTNTGTATFTISPETGSTASITTTGHAPYLSISYCPPPTTVSASGAPTSLCEGSVLALTGTGAAAAGGTLSWQWNGPGAYSSTSISPTLTTTAASSGVYTLTVTNTCTAGAGTASATTAYITVNPLPSAITGGPDVCTGSMIPLSSLPAGGTWVSGTPAAASIDAISGQLTGNASGFTLVTYTDPAGCTVTGTFTDNNAPSAISGLTNVCSGSTILLTDGVTGGVWSDDGTGTVSTVPGSGAVTGDVAGPATIYYTTGGCAPVSYAVTVVPLPSPITGLTNVCAGSTILLSDPDAGGVWSSGDIMVATVSPTGDVFGVNSGTADILYTNPATTCQTEYTIVVNALPDAIGGLTNVCIGSSIALTESTPGGIYSGSGAFASVSPAGVVTGTTVGVADVTYTITSSSCIAATSITVNPLPAAIATGTGIVCQNATTPYTDSDPGGTWSSINIGVASAAPSSGIITGVASGITTIIYTLTTGCTASAPITVNPAPASVITASGPTTFCAGSSVVLNGSAGAGYLYQWNVAGAEIAGATTSSYDADATGAYTLSITNGFSCVTTSLVTNVVDGITGHVTNATSLSFCVGNGVLLYANTGSVAGTLTYQWRLNGVSISGAIDSSYNATASGEYSCNIEVSGGSGSCPILSDSEAVVVNPLPTPTITYTGSELTTAAGYSGYQWYENTVSLPGATSDILVPGSNGAFKVLVTDGNNCSGFSEALIITSVGVNNVNNTQGIKISPNPAATMLHIDAQIPVKAVISGIDGKILIEQADVKNIDISNLTNGLYLISVYDQKGNKVMTDKFVKE